MIGLHGVPGALIFASRRKTSVDGVGATFRPHTVEPGSKVRVTPGCTKVVPLTKAEQLVSHPPHFWMRRFCVMLPLSVDPQANGGSDPSQGGNSVGLPLSTFSRMTTSATVTLPLPLRS